MEASERSKKKWLMPVVIVIVAVALRLWSIDRCLWLDECYSLLRANGSMEEMLTQIAENDAHPPLFYMTLKLWRSICGDWPGMVRLLPVIFDLLTLWLIYLCLRMFIADRLAAMTALAAAVSCFMVQYAQDLRHYSLAGLIGVWSTYNWMRIGVGDAEKKHWISYLAAVVLGLHTFYYLAFLFAMHGLFLAILAWQKRQMRPLFWKWCLASTIAAWRFYHGYWQQFRPN